MSEIRVMVVEDEPLIAEDIREFLSNVDFEVAVVIHTLDDALKYLADNPTPDIALLDINLEGDYEGIKIAKEINEKYKFPFVYLTSYSNPTVLELAKPTHPMGYVVKPFEEQDLFVALEIALYNFHSIRKPNLLKLETINPKLETPITHSEFKILAEIFNGKTNKQMAEIHFISVNTIKTHIKNLYSKVQVNSRTGLINRVLEIIG